MIKFFTNLIPVSLFFLFLALVPTNLQAQWNTNTYVNLEISSLPLADMVAVPTTDGKTWIAFYHENAGNYDMRAQLIDADGYKLLGPDGILVSNQPSGSATFVFNACVDGSNNLIIGCQDQRSGNMQAVLYKISQTGTHIWSSNGVILGNGMVPYPAALSTGETAVCWNDDASNTLNIQKISATGSIAWATPITVLVGSSTTTRGQIVGNTNGKFTMVYQKNAGGISTNLYAQMFSNSGTAAYLPLQIGNQTTAPYRYYSILADADTTYFGYYASPGLRFNSFLQRINPNGTIPWGMNGSNFNTSTAGTDNYQMETRINMTAGSNNIWAVCSFCDPNQDNYGIYVQKFLKTTGARQLTDQGKMVYAINPQRYIQAGDLAVINDTPMFMFYIDDYRIYATRLDGSGNFTWPGNQVEISSTTTGAGNPKGRYCFSPDGPNRCAGTWSENRGGVEKGYAQGISVNGLIGLDVTTQGGVPATINTSGGTLQLVATVIPSTANQSVNWSIIPVTGAATINTSGLVTALFDGTVWARAVSVQDNTMRDSLLVTITNQVPILATVVTLPANDVTLSTATLNGSVNANNWTSTNSFEWGPTTSYGNTVTATPGQATGSSTIPVSANLSSLASGTTYHYRCVANNLAGAAYGQDLTFTTQCFLAGTIGTITGPSVVCATSTGNVYSIPAYPGATSYIWTLPPGATVTAGNNTNSITVSYAMSAQSGNFTVYATDGTCVSLVSQAYSVTVNPVPVQAGPIDGVQAVCEGATGVPYSIPPMPGVSDFVWTVPAGAVIASGQNTTSITVDYPLGATAGNITVYGTNSCGTGALSDPLFVDVYPLPGTPGVISGPDHVCTEAFGVVYSVAAVSNAYGYVWTIPPGAEITAGANTNQINVHFPLTAASGNITVYGTNGSCLGETSAPLAVTVNTTPPTPVITVHGDTLESSSDQGNQWYLEGNLIPGATGKQYIAVVAGNYTVVVTLNGCSSAVSNSLLVLPVGLNENSLVSGFEVFPVPTNGLVNVQFNTSKDLECSLSLSNDMGQIVWQKAGVRINGSYTEQLDLRNFKAGIYLLQLRNPELSLSKRILIVH